MVCFTVSWTIYYQIKWNQIKSSLFKMVAERPRYKRVHSTIKETSSGFSLVILVAMTCPLGSGLLRGLMKSMTLSAQGSSPYSIRMSLIRYKGIPIATCMHKKKQNIKQARTILLNVNCYPVQGFVYILLSLTWTEWSHLACTLQWRPATTNYVRNNCKD